MLRARERPESEALFLILEVKALLWVSVTMSAKDQVTKMLDQLMGQNRDGEWNC